MPVRSKLIVVSPLLREAKLIGIQFPRRAFPASIWRLPRRGELGSLLTAAVPVVPVAANSFASGGPESSCARGLLLLALAPSCSWRISRACSCSATNANRAFRALRRCRLPSADSPPTPLDPRSTRMPRMPRPWRPGSSCLSCHYPWPLRRHPATLSCPAPARGGTENLHLVAPTCRGHTPPAVELKV